MAKITAPQCHRRALLSYRSFFYIHSHFFFAKKSFSSKFIFAPRILMIFSSGAVCFIFIWLFFLSWINNLHPDDTRLVLLSRKAYQHFHVNKKTVYTIRTVTERRVRANKRALAHFSISWILRIGVRLLQLRWYVKPIPIHFHLTYLHSPYIFNIHPYYTP